MSTADDSGFIWAPQPPPPPHHAGGESHPKPGDTLDSFVLVRKIGDGGFGEVWLADQSRPVQRIVAVKIIKPQADRAEVRERFRSEVDTLASMDHPNICRFFDAGRAPWGPPYFAMEYVPGTSLIEHCDAYRLTIRQRLCLFKAICDAVQHAHNKGVIHRDLKPSNILVVRTPDDQSVPKVVDFGIAKVMAPRFARDITRTGTFLGTLPYMAPEQLGPDAPSVDIRTDVYSLGVILYQLMVGRTPFDVNDAQHELIRKICQEEPPTPAKRLSELQAPDLTRIADTHGASEAELRSAVRGELQWIPRMALDKQPPRRYRSAGELGHDIDNYLNSRPLIAHPPSLFYRTRKFVRQHKAAAVVSAAIALSLALGAGATLWQAGIAAQRLVIATRALAATQQQRTLARGEAYAASIAAASTHLRLGQPDECRRVLQACPSELRNWEYRFLDANADTSAQTQDLKGPPRQLIIAPDATRLAVVNPAEWSFWNLPRVARRGAAIQPERPDPRSDSRPDVFRMSPDMQRVLVASSEEANRFAVQVCRASPAERPGPGAPHAAAPVLGTLLLDCPRAEGAAEFSPDGAFVAMRRTRAAEHDIGRPGIVVLPCQGGDPVWLPDAPCFAFEPDSRTITLGNESLSRYHVDGTSKGHWIPSHAAGSPRRLALDPTGRLAALAKSDALQIWDLSTQRALATLPGEARGLAFSPDGSRIACGIGSVAMVFRARDGATLMAANGHLNEILTATFSPDATQLFTADKDGILRVWDLRDAAALADVPSVRRLRLSPDGSLLAAISRSDRQPPRVTILNANTGVILSQFSPQQDSLAFSPDGRVVATGILNSTIQLWDPLTGSLTSTIEISPTIQGPTRLANLDPMEAGTVAFIDGSSTLCLVEAAETLRFSIISEQGTVLARQEWPRASLAFASDVPTLAVSSDGGLVAVAHSATIQVLDRSTGIWSTRPLPASTDPTRPLGDVMSLAFEPQGPRLAALLADGTLLIWDAPAAPTKRMAARTDGMLPVRVLWLTPDRVAASVGDSTIRVFDADSGRLLMNIEAQGSVLDIAARHDRLFAAVAGEVIARWKLSK